MIKKAMTNIWLRFYTFSKGVSLELMKLIVKGDGSTGVLQGILLIQPPSPKPIHLVVYSYPPQLKYGEAWFPISEHLRSIVWYWYGPPRWRK